MEALYPVFEKLLENGIKIHIITRDPIEHEDDYMRNQSTNEILRYTELGINIVLLNGFHHRKLAMINRNILWEGSLNILSQTKSLTNELLTSLADEMQNWAKAILRERSEQK